MRRIPPPDLAQGYLTRTAQSAVQSGLVTPQQAESAELQGTLKALTDREAPYGNVYADVQARRAFGPDEQRIFEAAYRSAMPQVGRGFGALYQAAIAAEERAPVPKGTKALAEAVERSTFCYYAKNINASVSRLASGARPTRADAAALRQLMNELARERYFGDGAQISGPNRSPDADYSRAVFLTLRLIDSLPAGL